MHSSSSNPWFHRIVPVTLTLFLGVLAAPALAAPDLSDSYLERGAAAEKAGDFIAAENCYHLALRAKPGSVTAKSRLDSLLKKSPLPDLMSLAVGPIHTGNRTLGSLLDLLVQRVEERSNGRLEAALVIEDPDGSLSASRPLTATFNENASLKAVLDFLTQQVSAKYDLQGKTLRILSRQALAGRGAPSPAAPGTPVSAVAQTTTPSPAEQADAAVAVSFIGSNEKPAALNDGTIPANSDQAQGRFSWKPHVGTLEWTEYRFTQPKSVAGCEVYWASSSLQAPKAADRVGLPEYWRVLYQNQEGEWWPVDTEPPPPSLDGWNVCRFSPVKAAALRLMIQLGSLSSAGLHEWKVIPGPAEVPPPPRALDFRLDQVLPVSAAVGYRSFRVNKYSATEERNGGRILLDGQPCERFLYAHASSTLTYAVPAGFARFSAVGIKPSHMPNSSWTYRVMADGIPVFESGLLESYPNHQLPIDVPLPDGCRTLTLVTDAAGNGQGDHSIWAMPKLTRGPAEPPTWTSVDGKSLVAAFTRMEAGSVVVMKDGRETKIPLSRLDATSQEQAKRLAAAAPTPSPAAPPAAPAAPAAPLEGGSQALFDGKSLAGWKVVGENSVFGVVDGAIQGQGKGASILYTGTSGSAASWKDFDLSFKVRTDGGANSGVWIHCSPDAGPKGALSLEVQIDNQGADSQKTGSIYGIRQLRSSPRKDGEWFEMRIKVTGPVLTVWIDGKEVNTWSQPAEWQPPPPLAAARLGHGMIGFQANGGTVAFKDIRIVGPGAAPAVAPTPAPTTPAGSSPTATSAASSMAQLRKIAEKVVAINPQGLRLFIDRRVVAQSRLPLPAGVFEIQELSVGGELAKAITDDDVDLLAAGRGAKVLALNDVSITRLSGIQPNRGLQKLSINGTAIGDEALTALEGMRELTELSLNGCKISGSGLGVLKSSPKLQVLSLWSNPLGDASLPIIGSFKSLTTLSLGYTKVTSPALIHLSGLTKLSRLHLDGLKLEPGALDFLAGTKSLTVLDLNGTDISRSLLPMLGSGAPMQSLWLASSKIDGQPFNDADLAAFAEAPKLQSLILSDTAVTGTGLGTLVKTRSLKTLEIERNSALTDDGLAVIVRTHPGLTMLALGGKITAASMGQLSQLRQLTHLRLNGDSLADNDLAGLPPLRDLTKLEIHAPKATSATATAIARQPNLTSLAVGGTAFNDDAIPELSKLKSLRELNIGQCAFSPSGLEKLHKALPSCVINR